MITSSPSGNARSVQDVYAEGLRYFMGQGELNNALDQIVADLREHEIDYVVIGAVALLAHGYPRFTEDIDLVLTPEGLDRFDRELVEPGYAPAFPGARKRFRSTRFVVNLELIAAGEFPGDGNPKPISFPQPSEASIEIGGIRFVTLEKLIELKLASGMTASDRLKDLADVQELIKIKELKVEFANRLDPYVRRKFIELCKAVEEGRQHAKE